jgi:hypothetical protein
MTLLQCAISAQGRPRSTAELIAVHFEPNGLTTAERDGFEYGIGCITTWVSEDGRDC